MKQKIFEGFELIFEPLCYNVFIFVTMTCQCLDIPLWYGKIENCDNSLFFVLDIDLFFSHFGQNV